MGPRQQAALVGTSDGAICLVQDAAMPQVRHDGVLVKVKAIAVNPVDSKMVGSYVTAGAVLGCDFAGVVVESGADSKEASVVNDVHIGDRVCSFVMGMNPRRPSVGAFAEYTSAQKHLLLKMPPAMSYEEGAGLGTSFLTAGMALFHSLRLDGHPLDPRSVPNCPVLVYGGSSATGTAAIQLLRLAGFDPVTTCSPHNFVMVRSCGAAAVFDYHGPDCAEQIKKHTKSGLRYALDCISTVASMKLCYQAMGRLGGKYTSLEPYAESIAQDRKLIKADWIMTPQLLGDEVAWPEPHYRPADPAVERFGAVWVETLNKLLEKGLIRSHPVEVRQGGLDRVMQGVQDARSQSVSGRKLVYRLG
ncbi:zinc-binding dehydrogenase family oxidoreductase [Apiospora saccharicola]